MSTLPIPNTLDISGLLNTSTVRSIRSLSPVALTRLSRVDETALYLLATDIQTLHVANRRKFIVHISRVKKIGLMILGIDINILRLIKFLP